MKLTYFIYLQLTIRRLIKHFTVIYADANKQCLTLNLIFFAAKKSPYLGPQSPYQKLQTSLFEPKKISHVCSVVECRTPEREVGGSKPTAAMLCPWARHFTPRKYWLITQEAVAPSRHDWKIVDWDVKPQHKQTNLRWVPSHIVIPHRKK